MIRDRLNLPVFLKNNATAAAVGERWYGECHPQSTFFYLYFGVGLGGGMVHNGHPFEGFYGNAGEIGYIPTPSLPSEASDPAGHIGEHFNLPSLYERLESSGLSASQPSDLGPIYASGASTLQDWVHKAVDHLVHLVLSIEYLIDPETVFFGGRLPTPMIQDLMGELEARLPERRIRGKVEVPELRPSSAGEDAAALGVATLPLYEFFAPAPSLLHKGNGSDASAA
jgi:predicted NBD/HSP70 family sugar kinase